MKNLMAIILISISFNCLSQSNKVTYNQVDEKGFKQGLWIQYEIDSFIKDNKKAEVISLLTDTNSFEIPKNDTFFCKSIFFTGYYFDNKKDSIWMIYNTTKKKYIYKDEDSINIGELLYAVSFKNDSLNGILKTYYPSGSVKSEIEFNRGLASGEIKCYFSSGKLKFEGVMIPTNEYFNGVEYSENGYKIRDRKFSYNITLQDWTNLDDLYKRILIE